MDNDAVALQKRALRAELRALRNQITLTEVPEFREGFASQLKKLVERFDAKLISCYLSAPHEPDIREFLNWAHELGVKVLFPITREDGLLDWAIGDGESETVGLFGMPEVVGEVLSPLTINEVDLIIVPAAAVDVEGYRMGWGRGYFDRTLSSMEAHPPVYAVVFDNEVLDRVPRHDHDQRVNGAVTPTRIVDFTEDV